MALVAITADIGHVYIETLELYMIEPANGFVSNEIVSQ